MGGRTDINGEKQDNQRKREKRDLEMSLAIIETPNHAMAESKDQSCILETVDRTGVLDTKLECPKIPLRVVTINDAQLMASIILNAILIFSDRRPKKWRARGGKKKGKRNNRKYWVFT